jgi:riboflavin synthase
MFTGIITDLGRVRAVRPAARGRDSRFEIETRFDLAGVTIGASVACSGPCLTVNEKGADWFAVEASAETLSRTTLGGWLPGTRVNLERSLAAGDELGGHLVTGHVDAVVRILGRAPEGGSIRFDIELPAALARYVAEKGSVALDGVSLTVNGVGDERFSINVIGHTQAATTLGRAAIGDRLNMEVDTLARYVERQMAALNLRRGTRDRN